MKHTPRTALTIAGSDSGGGAGIQADLRTFFAHGVHGMTAITAVTVQNSLGVADFTEIPVEVITSQIRSVAGDLGVQAAKTGMLPTAESISAVGKALDDVGIGRAIGTETTTETTTESTTPLVVDPVAASMHGDALLHEEALYALRTELFPRASLITPNLDEVRLLTGIDVTDRRSQYKAAEALLSFGSPWVLVTGGHLFDDTRCVDLLSDGTQVLELDGERHHTEHTHGGGDTLAAAITAALARGLSMPDAVTAGKNFVERCVAESYPLGAGVGPVSAFWRLAENDQG